jgi:hypothetical protein
MHFSWAWFAASIQQIKFKLWHQTTSDFGRQGNMG